MKYLKFVILLLVLCNLPYYLMAHYSIGLGAVLSYCTFFLIIVYYLLSKKQRPVIHFIIFGALFFLITLIVKGQFSATFLVTFVKYFVFIIMMSTVLKDVKNEEIYGILLIGSLSIIYEAVFVNTIGASGIYASSNFAAYVCILGYALGLGVKNKALKIIGQVIFSIAGLITLSIIFLVTWMLISLFFVFVGTRNIYKLIVCIGLFTAFISFGDKLPVNSKRSDAHSGISREIKDSKLKEEPETATWTLYYDKVFGNPIWGNGYGQTPDGDDIHFTIKVGLHNTFLMILGEAGVFALLYFLWIYGYVTMESFHFFKQNPTVFCISLALILFMLTTYSYFDNYLVLFTSLWLYHEVYKMRNINWNRARIILRSAGSIEQANEEKLLGQYHLN